MENRSSLFAFVFAVVRDFNAAEELLQETSVVICENANDFTPGTSFGAWSREIARRRIRAYFRQQKREKRILSEDHIHNLQQAFAAVEDRIASPHHRLQAMRRCLEKLTPRVRHWLYLRYVSQLALVEMASQVRCKPESIRKTLYRSRQQLRVCIERRLRMEERF
jgi:RNA polymerase sigma-70 factor (ECF subfamily)